MNRGDCKVWDGGFRAGKEVGMAVWQHGKRCHGYWLLRGENLKVRDIRIAFIGLPPRVFTAKRDGYTWEFRIGTFLQEGTTKTLRQAKRAVEKSYYEYLTQHPSFLKEIEEGKHSIQQPNCW